MVENVRPVRLSRGVFRPWPCNGAPEYDRRKGGSEMEQRLRWGILGAGAIAQTFARGLAVSRTGTLVAVGSRTRAAAESFGDAFEVAHRHSPYDDVLADVDVDAVYIATPHPMHAEWAIKAAEAGKHILCEKPLTLNHAEAMAVVEAARARNVFLMEAFLYRCHPQTAALVDLIRTGAIGAVRLIQATYGFNATFDPDGRLFRQDLGGGGILDVGCYPVSFARLIAGAATGRAFADPIEVKGTAQIGPVSRIDEYAVAAMRFPGDILAELATGVQVRLENIVRVFGSEGQVRIPAPWLPSRGGAPTELIVERTGEESRTVLVPATIDPYAVEADYVAEQVAASVLSPPAMAWDDSLGNMQTLDQWRDAIGLVYDRERQSVATVHRRPLAVRPDHTMRYGTIAGIAKPISRLVMGVDNQRTLPHAAVMFDDFFARGGNAFDTAWVYAGGQCERLLGQWVRERGVREQVVILDKGAHTPFCTPEDCGRQLLESLDRLQMEYVDIYMLHRDNPAIPVEAFIDVLNEHAEAGRVRLFGASNWSLARIEAANSYARAKGMRGFSAVSNNFSLARMVEPVWAGCIAASDAASRAWFTETQMPLLPWSSQARGFFTDRARPDDTSDPELVRCWYSADNFARKERVETMAKERGVLPINIALAYVLCQPFPTFALFGPRTLAETRTSLPALDIALTPDELRWLNVEG
jgi:predicted dehydrogenase/aryl-alcohol dehydrogenase-like predicted oxidoreductase